MLHGGAKCVWISTDKRELRGSKTRRQPQKLGSKLSSTQ